MTRDPSVCQGHSDAQVQDARGGGVKMCRCHVTRVSDAAWSSQSSSRTVFGALYMCLLHSRNCEDTHCEVWSGICHLRPPKPLVYLIAIRTCMWRDVQSFELHLLVRHLSYYNLNDSARGTNVSQVAHPDAGADSVRIRNTNLTLVRGS